MTPLRQRMLEDMQLRGLAARTQESYLAAVQQLAVHYATSPELIAEEQLRQYFLYACEVEHPDWMNPGRDPETMRRSRDRLMAEATASHALLVFTHAPFPGWGRIVPTATGYRWEWA